jgi:hypothetical protein
VVVSFSSANRDKAVFGNAARLDIRRHPSPSFLRSNLQRGVKRLPIAWTA